ncbi:GT-D fold domain-containing glycosyltransferase [Arthrobacter sp.]|uniref:GT-D fold domain-containing glycosyltransferase n=1 Tax=Arthrobacter sp. TaxID=1667 RepID=UPI003A8FB445
MAEHEELRRSNAESAESVVKAISEQNDHLKGIAKRLDSLIAVQRDARTNTVHQLERQTKNLENIRLNSSAATLRDIWSVVGSKQLSLIETLDAITEEGLSFARFGDGELKMLTRIDFKARFQRNSPELQAALRSVLTDPPSNLLIGAPHAFSDVHWTRAYAEYWDSCRQLFGGIQRFGDSHVSRPVVFESHGALAAERWSRVWAGKRILIITGEGSRFDLIPELFSTALGQEFLYSKPRDAFDDLDRLVIECKSRCADIVLISLGPAGTILAALLASEGLQAIDLGHLSNSYLHVFAGGELPERTPIERRV